MQIVNILGTEYKLIESDSGKDPSLKSADGYCDNTIKTLVVKDIVPDTNSFGDLKEYKKRVIRHELIHAFLFESGLDNESWAGNEEIVDWIANQFPKLLRAFKTTNAL